MKQSGQTDRQTHTEHYNIDCLYCLGQIENVPSIHINFELNNFFNCIGLANAKIRFVSLAYKWSRNRKS